MEESSLVDKVHGLSDLELETLLSLLANEHCIIWTQEDALDTLSEELELICNNVFGLPSVAFDCTETTTLEDFSNGILVAEETAPTSAHSPIRSSKNSSFQQNAYSKAQGISMSGSLFRGSFPETQKIANVVIAKNLSSADSKVQIQALELIKSRRVFTRTSVQAAPKRFLFIALLSIDSTPLEYFLNDHILLSHYHDPEDGFPNIEESETRSMSDADSSSSVVRIPWRPVGRGQSENPLLNEQEIDFLIAKGFNVHFGVEVKRYLFNIIAFLRMHRAVQGGITSRASKHFELLAKCLAPLHSLDYVTPSLVALAARKVYPHRISIATPNNERSMQWGSKYDAVKSMLDNATPEDVIDEVLRTVESPL